MQLRSTILFSKQNLALADIYLRQKLNTFIYSGKSRQSQGRRAPKKQIIYNTKE